METWKSLKNYILKNICQQVFGVEINYNEDLKSFISDIIEPAEKKVKAINDNDDDNKFIKLIKKIFNLILSIFKALFNFFESSRRYVHNNYKIIVLSLIISIVWQFSNYISRGNNVNDLWSNSFWILLSKYINFYFSKILVVLILPTIIKEIIENNKKKIKLI